MLVDVNSEVISDKSPYSDIKLSVVVQKWLLDIFLNHPEGVLLIFLKDELRNVSHVFENLDAPALVERGRLDQPHVARAVLQGHFLIP